MKFELMGFKSNKYEFNALRVNSNPRFRFEKHCCQFYLFYFLYFSIYLFTCLLWNIYYQSWFFFFLFIYLSAFFLFFHFFYVCISWLRTFFFYFESKRFIKFLFTFNLLRTFKIFFLIFIFILCYRKSGDYASRECQFEIV